MSNPDQHHVPRPRRALILAAATASLVIAGGAVGWAVSTGSATPADAPRKTAADTTRGAAEEADAEDTSEEHLDWSSLSPAVLAQLEYVRDHWHRTESDRFGFLPVRVGGFALGREFVNRLVGSRKRLFGRDVFRIGFGNGPVVPVR